MKFFLRFAIFLLCCMQATTPLIAETVYKSIGPDGKIVYSDHPVAEAKVVKTMKFDNLPSSVIPGNANATSNQPNKMAHGPVAGLALFSATWCGYCKQAKAYLAAKGITYQEFDIETESGQAAFTQAGGNRAIPLLVAGDQHVQGFTSAAYDYFFANRK